MVGLYNVCAVCVYLLQATTHFNHQLSINRGLRDSIDHLRQERALFNSLYKRVWQELQNCKHETMDIIMTSTQALEQRSVWL